MISNTCILILGNPVQAAKEIHRKWGVHYRKVHPKELEKFVGGNNRREPLVSLIKK